MLELVFTRFVNPHAASSNIALPGRRRSAIGHDYRYGLCLFPKRGNRFP
ncbi:hypothetical protein ACWCPQ_11260 [Nocardia sp. NPDC001965]